MSMSEGDRSRASAETVPIPLFTQQSSGSLLRASALLFCICSHAAVDTFAQSVPLVAIDREARENAMGYEWLRWSTEHIGHRLTGSPNGRKAEALADSLLRANGLARVEQFPFSTQAWSRGSILLELIGDTANERIEAVALANTPVDCDVTLELIDAGNGLRADLDALEERIRGKALMMNLGLLNAAQGTSNLHRSEKTALALERGAAGVVFVNNVSGHVLLTGTASIDGTLIAIPAVCIASEDGALLRSSMHAGEQLRVRVNMKNTSASVGAHNVIAEIHGTRYPEEVVLIGGHLDSWDLATGATDNGLGSFSIIDMARCFHALGITPLRTIRFVLFMGEEQGLLGSRALVDHYRTTGELDHLRCMINLDMSGHPQGFNAAGPEGWTELIEQINQRIDGVDSSFAAKVSGRVGLHSDHQPFLLAGVPILSPICDLGHDVYGCYHSSCDDIHLVDPEAMVNNVRYVGMLVHELAMSEMLPPQFTEEQLRERLVAAGLEEPLRVGGDWPW